MKKTLLFLTAAFCLLTLLLPYRACAAVQTAYVNGGDADRVHLRAAPSTEAASLGLYFTGVPLLCHTDPSAEWVHVTIGQANGYMMSRYVYSGPEPETVPIVQYKGYVSTSGGTALYAAPAAEADTITALKDGMLLIVLGETADHRYYVYRDGLCGYVPASAVTLEGRVEEPVRCGYAAPELRTLEPRLYAVLFEGERFWHDQVSAYVTLSELSALYDGQPVAFPVYTCLDVDRDGDEELVLWQTVGMDEHFGFLVLDAADSTVYGYEVGYRGMNELKADGTFSFSSSAFESGFGYARLDGRFGIIAVAESCYDEDEIRYYRNGEAIPEEVFHALLEEQSNKPSASWYPLVSTR